MILYDIRRYLMANERVSLMKLAYHFDKDPELIRSMLYHWIRKGKLHQVDSGLPCKSGCNKCDESTIAFYEWKVLPKGVIASS